MRRDVVLSIVHPEIYFPFEGEEQNLSFSEREPELLADLSRVSLSLDIPIHVHRLLDLSQGRFGALFSQRVVTDINFMAAGLEMLIPGKDSSYAQLRSLYLMPKGVPLSNQVIDHPLYPAFAHAGFAPLTQSEHHSLLFPYDHAVHFLMGGIFSRSVANYGAYTSAVFPSAKYFFIDELCIASSVEDHAFAQRCISSFGKSISFSETLKLLQQ